MFLIYGEATAVSDDTLHHMPLLFATASILSPTNDYLIVDRHHCPHDFDCESLASTHWPMLTASANIAPIAARSGETLYHTSA